jgi:NAD(P)-dependent dehydrogenase (short-subunit alcohol dehydrogenase family)
MGFRLSVAIEGAGMMDSDGQVVMVTGASAGIGLAVARRFAADGAHVVMLARRPERLAEAAAAVGPNAFPVTADVADPDSVRAAFSQVEERFGRLDALFNVAGAALVRLIEEASDEDIATVVGANLLGPIYTTRAAIPLLRKSTGGDIVNVSSEVTLDDLPLMTLYSATKRGLDGFTRTMTKELRNEGIRVTLVVMGTVGDTSFSDNFGPGDGERAYPVWQADGYMTRVAGSTRPIDADAVADTLVYVVTRPEGMMLDVIHVRAVG